MADVSQKQILNKMLEYVERVGQYDGQVRDSYLFKGGDCNGFAFLKGYYQAIGKASNYQDKLHFISNWNGDIQNLLHSSALPTSLQPYYRNGLDLFEQTVNDIAFLSHVKTDGIYNPIANQKDRVHQWDVLKPASEASLNTGYQKPFLKVADVDTLVTHLEAAKTHAEGKAAIIDISVFNTVHNLGHSLNVTIDKAGQFFFYDCNTKSISSQPLDAKATAEQIFAAGDLAFAYEKGTIVRKILSVELSLDESTMIKDHALELESEELESFEPEASNHAEGSLSLRFGDVLFEAEDSLLLPASQPPVLENVQPTAVPITAQDSASMPYTPESESLALYYEPLFGF